MQLTQDYFKGALKHLSMAYCKRFCKCLSWGFQLEELWGRCLKECTDWLSNMDDEGMDHGTISSAKWAVESVVLP